MFRTGAALVALCSLSFAIQGCGSSDETEMAYVNTTGNASTTESPVVAEVEVQTDLGAANARIVELHAELDALQNSSEERIAKLKAELAMWAPNCTSRCHEMAVTGRWRLGEFGHECEDSLSGNTYCKCSTFEDHDTACAETKKARRTAARAARARQLQTEEPATQTARGFAVASEKRNGEPVPEAAAPLRQLGSPRETVTNYCDAAGLAKMYGGDDADVDQAEAFEASQLNQMESAVLEDISKELETNNVDKMARDIFSFYACVRWVPDETFWKLAEQELAAELITSVVDHKEDLDQAISELYQAYKFVPMLCSQNIPVFEDTDDDDLTYFRAFSKRVDELGNWLKNSGDSSVLSALKETDEIFCGNDNMNDPGCLAGLSVGEWLNSATSKLGDWATTDFESRDDKWKAMSELFKRFGSENQESSDWTRSLQEWKRRFPFHSFVHKPEGMPSSGSPTSDQRFLVCFGKRVASELHRRPAGQHIMTDQNNIGCHGFWNSDDVSSMLDRMVELWKPPTCQLSEMTYIMKRQILEMFGSMNTRLFDALPTMLMDEELANQGLLEQHMAGPLPFSPDAILVEGQEYVDGMRVRALTENKRPFDCVDVPLSEVVGKKCDHIAEAGDLGTLEVDPSSAEPLMVIWDTDSSKGESAVGTAAIEIIPREWEKNGGVGAFASDLVAGVSQIADGALDVWNGMFRQQYTSLATMMSGSTSKWAVCPVKSDVNMTELDGHLGVEDAAFQDHQKEAYAKWTGYTAKIPGEECETPAFLKAELFGESQICEISELHADHLEKYTKEDGTLEEFICPLKVPLPASEQLTVLHEKNTCFLRMTENQLRHYQWQYNGKYPARKQNDRKPNVPGIEYELIKLSHVPGSGAVSFGKTCSLEEWQQVPRFCRSPTVRNVWPTSSEMAQMMALAVTGSVGVGATAIVEAVGAYQSILAIRDNNTMNRTAQVVGEQIWDTLTGTGRLLWSAGKAAVSELTSGLSGASERNLRMEAEFFGDGDPGELLHSMSYQRSIGASGATSNSKERFQRYVMTYPCTGFEPAYEFALKKQWSAVALRVVREAVQKSHVDGDGVPLVLKSTLLEATVRAEAALFLRQNEETGDETWYTYGASMTVTSSDVGDWRITGYLPQPDQPDCEWQWSSMSCSPDDQCRLEGLKCVPEDQPSQPTLASEGWWRVLDDALAKAVGGLPVEQQELSELKGLHVSFYCGPKSLFDPTIVAHAPEQSSSLVQCLQSAVKSNSVLRAKQPWKLYLPEEVIVVAIFQEVETAYCFGSGLTQDLCAGGAKANAEIESHLSATDKQSLDGAYQGLRTGNGYPQGTLAEVVMRPEDLLEVAGIFTRP
mmetsp:Transcript_45545/g.103193  ORF Transcript_45545/g.103193 Transcript_45545/m.103193 type:complete len:1343 (-) Transcript_45545:175-4203(-)